MRTTIFKLMHALSERGSRTSRIRSKLRFSLWLLAAVLVALAPAMHASTFPLPHHDERLHKEIEALESEWRNAVLTNDVSAIDQLLADDYLGVTANGMLETKADALALRRSGGVRISELQPSDVKVRVYGTTAVVTSRVELQGTSDDRDISGTYRYTRVYNKRSGSWKIVSFEASRISPGGGRH